MRMCIYRRPGLLKVNFKCIISFLERKEQLPKNLGVLHYAVGAIEISLLDKNNLHSMLRLDENCMAQASHPLAPAMSQNLAHQVYGPQFLYLQLGRSVTPPKFLLPQLLFWNPCLTCIRLRNQKVFHFPQLPIQECKCFQIAQTPAGINLAVHPVCPCSTRSTSVCSSVNCMSVFLVLRKPIIILCISKVRKVARQNKFAMPFIHCHADSCTFSSSFAGYIYMHGGFFLPINRSRNAVVTFAEQRFRNALSRLSFILDYAFSDENCLY